MNRRITATQLALTLLFSVLAWAVGAADMPPASSPWTYSLSLAAKEAFDSNVYLQSVAPLAERESLVTTLIPSLGVNYSASPKFAAALTYSPEVNLFHSESSESFTLHRSGLKLGGKVDNTTWESVSSFIAIQGDDEGLVFLQGPPAGGGPAVRDRRDAMIGRSTFRLTQKLGDYFVRPVIEGYLHDFQTVQKTNAGYLNFVDRDDLNGGLDLGWNAGKSTYAVLGYRYGAQHQDQLFPAISSVHYDSTYHRVLVGLEGKPWNWLQVNLSVGPEFRRYSGSLPATFTHVNETYAYVDAGITVVPAKSHTLTFKAKSFEQPGFSGRSAYLDTTLDLAWRWKTTDQLTVGLGFRAYNTSFLPPVERDDWIYTGSAVLAYTFNPRFSGEISYSYDDADSDAKNASGVSLAGGDYDRHLVAVGLKYTFK